MSLVEHYPPLIIPPEESYTDGRGHVTKPIEIPPMDKALHDALASVPSEEDVGHFEHAVLRAEALMILAAKTVDDPKSQERYLDFADAALNQAHELLGYDAPLDKSNYDLAA